MDLLQVPRIDNGLSDSRRLLPPSEWTHSDAPMMQLLNLIFANDWFTARQVHQLACEVAQRCLAILPSTVEDRVRGMRPAEAKGYLRARTLEAVLTEADWVIRHRGCQPQWKPRLVARATEELVTLALRHLLPVEVAGKLWRKAA